MSAHPCYHGMKYTEDHAQIRDWAPLLMEGRDPAQPVAATRIINGADVNYGALTRNLLDYLRKQDGFAVHFSEKVTGLHRLPEGGWRLEIANEATGARRTLDARIVFLGAGGAAITLLQKSGISEAEGFAGFPVSGIWLRCDRPEVVDRHTAKVYGMAAAGSPPMSVPHLDTRIIEGKRWLLFGPYAGFSTKFLKHGSLLDLPLSLRPGNILPLLVVARDNFPLEEYLVGQVFQQLAPSLRGAARVLSADQRSRLASLGRRPATPRSSRRTAPVPARWNSAPRSSPRPTPRSLPCSGASPGASTATWIVVQMLESCFHEQLLGNWQPKLEEMLPSHGHDLKQDAALLRRVRAETAEVLGLQNV